MTSPSSPYAGRFAELYDAIYADKDYVGEVAWLRQHVSPAGARPRILDVACGSGRHAEQWLAHGCDVVGVDASVDMLAVARGRAPGASFVVGDMAALADLAEVGAN